MPPQANCALPAGFQLDQYRIVRQLSLGGFSIVYLAEDELGTQVAIKEYLPNSLALRKEVKLSRLGKCRLRRWYGMLAGYSICPIKMLIK